MVAYSTLSQLGYMTVALGASAYSAAIFHLMTHAFFKALLFLGAGSVIIAMHHEQDMRRMGGLRKYMPITYGSMLIGALATRHSRRSPASSPRTRSSRRCTSPHVPGATFAYLCVLACVFVTAFYTLPAGVPGVPRRGALPSGRRRTGMTTTGTTSHGHGHEPHESPWVVTVPLILLAIPSVCAGWLVGRCCSAATSATRSSSLPRTTGSRRWRGSGTASWR